MSSKVVIKYLGHATFLLTTPASRRALIDPWVMNNPACPEDDRSLDYLDLMLITHAHGDHFQDAEAIAKSCKPKIACIHEIGAYLEAKGVEKIHPMNKGGTQVLDDIRITMVDARHSSSFIQDGGAIYDGGEPAGFVLEFENGLRLYHAGDTCVFPGMQLIAELYQPDIAMLPIGDVYTMGPKEAACACRLLAAKKVIPMHYGTFPVLTGTPDKLREETKDHGVEIVELAPGEEYAVET